MLVVGALVAGEAAWSLVNAQQACFFGYPRIPCPAIDDPAVLRLTIAFLGTPVIWGVGLGFVLRRGKVRDAAKTGGRDKGEAPER
jgi:hypothetical protein